MEGGRVEGMPEWWKSAADAIGDARDLNAMSEKFRWGMVENKPKFIGYVAQRTGGDIDFSYLRRVAGDQEARQLLWQAAARSDVGPVAKAALRTEANRIAEEMRHHPPGTP
jgi:hypothetical protein